MRASLRPHQGCGSQGNAEVSLRLGVALFLVSSQILAGGNGAVNIRRAGLAAGFNRPAPEPDQPAQVYLTGR